MNEDKLIVEMFRIGSDVFVRVVSHSKDFIGANGYRTIFSSSDDFSIYKISTMTPSVRTGTLFIPCPSEISASFCPSQFECAEDAGRAIRRAAKAVAEYNSSRQRREPVRSCQISDFTRAE